MPLNFGPSLILLRGLTKGKVGDFFLKTPLKVFFTKTKHEKIVWEGWTKIKFESEKGVWAPDMNYQNFMPTYCFKFFVFLFKYVVFGWNINRLKFITPSFYWLNPLKRGGVFKKSVICILPTYYLFIKWWKIFSRIHLKRSFSKNSNFGQAFVRYFNGLTQTLMLIVGEYVPKIYFL